MQNYKTVVLGATTNASRYAWKATERLQEANIEVLAIGNKKGYCAGIAIQNGLQKHEHIHTITLYLNPSNQQLYYDFIVACQPQRVIFNPGTENPALYQLLRSELPNCQIEIACTLVLLSLNNYKN